MTATIDTPSAHAKSLARLAEDGACVLPGLLPLELVERLRVAFMPIYAAYAAAQPPNRGPARHYHDVPFAAPFADPLLYENEAVLALVDAVLGDDAMLLLYGGDTPVLGSETQGFHADLPELHADVVMPTFCLTVNIPLVDITPENGPFEGAPGTHRLANAEGMRRIERGEAALRPYLLRRGDVLVRDPRMLHRGTPNRTAEPRPVLVIAYHRPWYRHHGHEAMAICPALRDTLSARGRSLLRLHLDRRFA